MFPVLVFIVVVSSCFNCFLFFPLFSQPVAMTCVFLATKIEECQRSPLSIATVFHRVLAKRFLVDQLPSTTIPTSSSLKELTKNKRLPVLSSTCEVRCPSFLPL
jgi:hypothetical protein